MDDVKNDSWLDEQWEDFSGLEEEAEMIRQIAEAENDLMRRYKIPASKKTPASRKIQPAGGPKLQQHEPKPSRLLPPHLH